MNDFTKEELIQLSRTLHFADVYFTGIEELKSKISNMIDNYCMHDKVYAYEGLFCEKCGEYVPYAN